MVCCRLRLDHHAARLPVEGKRDGTAELAECRAGPTAAARAGGRDARHWLGHGAGHRAAVRWAIRLSPKPVGFHEGRTPSGAKR
jgi:hypothetical protein